MKYLLQGSALLIALFLYSCNSKPAPKAENTPVSTENKPAVDSNQKTVLATLTEIKSCSTLVAAINQAKMTEGVSKFLPFTIFAPSNEAFSKLPKSTFENLMKPGNEEKLSNIIQYHMTLGVYRENMLVDKKEIEMVNTQDIHITRVGDKVTINEKAKIVDSISLGKGMIYIIDEVLMPPVGVSK